MGIELESNTAALLERAVGYLRAGTPELAERDFRAVLEQDPRDLQALRFLAARHLERDERPAAIDLLERAESIQPGHAVTLHQLGVAYELEGRTADAVSALERCVAADGKQFVARLRLGLLLERGGERRRALTHYFSAIHAAQAQGRWLSEETTAPGLRQPVLNAMRFVDAGRRELFHRLLEPSRAKYGAIALRRVEHALAIYLGERTASLPDRRQRPRFLYFPDVPSQPYYPRERFPWQDALEEVFDTIRAELAWAMRQTDKIEPFLTADTPEQMDAMLRSSRGQAPSWDGYFFYRHGARYPAQCEGCPRTSAILDALPLVRIPQHAPEMLFSVLTPGSHILPHQGVTNTRLVTHLPLIVPKDCALRVGGEIHEWQEGRCVTFDDTFEHEAWNRSEQTRVVLIMDCWNPDLSEAERDAVADLVAGIGDFNRSCELPVE